MALLPIVKIPDPVLRKKAAPIGKISDKISSLIDDMFETMYNASGLGLAAPQVGISQRLFVVDCGEESSDDPNPLVFINPIILKKEGSDSINEGCLSIPGFRDDVPRAAKVVITAKDRTGKDFTLEAEGLLAICLQHEFDHLDGILFPDRLSKLKQEFFNQWLAKQSK